MEHFQAEAGSDSRLKRIRGGCRCSPSFTSAEILEEDEGSISKHRIILKFLQWLFVADSSRAIADINLLINVANPRGSHYDNWGSEGGNKSSAGRDKLAREGSKYGCKSS